LGKHGAKKLNPGATSNRDRNKLRSYERKASSRNNYQRKIIQSQKTKAIK
jgi:hypothetical protein